MSWQAYVDTSLVATQTVDKAAIFNKEGTSVWATTPGFTVKAEEINAIVQHYNEKPKDGAASSIFGSGFRLEGEKYLTIKADERSLYGKKGKEGAVIVLTKQAILIAHYGEHQQPGSATTTVEGLADYLIGVGY